MVAELEIRNVGGFRGTKTFSFKKKKLNEIRGSNSSGKTSVLKAILATLSIPKDGIFTNYGEDAKNLGIKSDELALDGFVNIYEEESSAKLAYDGKTHTYKVKSNGMVIDSSMGDEKFLLTGVIMNNSRVLKQLQKTSGGSDFRWLIDELSYADNYQMMNDYVDIQIEDIEEKIRQLEIREKRGEELKEKLETLIEKKHNSEKKKDNLKGKFDADLWEKGESLFKEKQGLETTIKKLEVDVKGQYKKSSSVITQLEKLKGESKIKEKHLEGIIKEKEELECMLVETEEDYKNRIADLKEERQKIDGEINIFQSGLTQLFHTDSVELDCFLCGKGKIKATSIKERLEELKSEKRSIESKIQDMSISRRGKERKIQELGENEKRLIMDIGEIEEDINEKENEISYIKSRIDKINKELKEKKVELKQKSDELTMVRGKTKEDVRDELKKTEQEIEQYYRQILDVENKIEEQKGKETILDNEYTADKAKLIYSNILKYYKEVADFSNTTANSHRKMARERFNDAMANLISKLGYEGFESVWLNNQGQLMVERNNKEGLKIQPVESLAYSEKCMVGITLAVSIKQSYLPDIPFFIVDDIMQDFDEDKKRGVYDYLKRIAEEENMYIIVSNLDQNQKEVKILEN